MSLLDFAAIMASSATISLGASGERDGIVMSGQMKRTKFTEEQTIGALRATPSSPPALAMATSLSTMPAIRRTPFAALRVIPAMNLRATA